MKIGIRKPSVKKRVKARTTGKVKRKVKSSINPFYGKKGMGYIKDPERAIKNKIYHKVTVDPIEMAERLKDDKDGDYDKNSYVYERKKAKQNAGDNSIAEKCVKIAIICMAVFFLVRFGLFMSGSGNFPVISLAFIIVLGIVYYKI